MDDDRFFVGTDGRCVVPFAMRILQAYLFLLQGNPRACVDMLTSLLQRTHWQHLESCSSDRRYKLLQGMPSTEVGCWRVRVCSALAMVLLHMQFVQTAAEVTASVYEDVSGKFLPNGMGTEDELGHMLAGVTATLNGRCYLAAGNAPAAGKALAVANRHFGRVMEQVRLPESSDGADNTQAPKSGTSACIELMCAAYIEHNKGVVALACPEPSKVRETH